jgi:Ca-activated chloride channel family protein
MKIIFTFIVFTYTLYANIFDDIKLYNSNNYLEKKDYKSAYSELNSISNKTNKIHYNIANTLYKQGKYEDAIKSYKEVHSKALDYNKLHNMGNAYAKLNNFDEAVKSYEEALRIKKDKDTQFNLELIKKKQKEQQKQKNKKEQQDKKNKNQKDKKDGSDKKSQDKKSKKKEENGEKKKDIKEKKDNISNNHQENKKKNMQDIQKNENNNTKPENLKNTDLSHLEEKKYQKLLNNRELNTLMIPLNTKGDKDEQKIKPW